MNSGKVFYTEDIKRNGSAVEFRDAQTGGVTTLQNSEIVQINKEAYETVVIQAQEVLFFCHGAIVVEPSITRLASTSGFIQRALPVAPD